MRPTYPKRTYGSHIGMQPAVVCAAGFERLRVCVCSTALLRRQPISGWCGSVPCDAISCSSVSNASTHSSVDTWQEEGLAHYRKLTRRRRCDRLGCPQHRVPEHLTQWQGVFWSIDVLVANLHRRAAVARRVSNCRRKNKLPGMRCSPERVAARRECPWPRSACAAQRERLSPGSRLRNSLARIAPS